MHNLVRQIRFSINPFSDEQSEGFNSYCAKPAGEGLAIFLTLEAELAGPIDSDTGFIVNVTDIDKVVRQYVVPIFVEQVKKEFRNGKHIELKQLWELLSTASKTLSDKFNPAKLKWLKLGLNPFRKLAISSEDGRMFYFSEKFDFAASHTLWNEKFSDDKNFEVFGKCANPAGHGHNYVIEVTVKKAVENEEFQIGRFEKIVHDKFIKMVDHKNLNEDVPEFGSVNPTVENIAAFAWKNLVGKFELLQLDSITVWENERTFCRYTGNSR
jgi:6-pyruvoyltetrahydropterin/6-carboxytetrahydropterin synthase